MVGNLQLLGGDVAKTAELMHVPPSNTDVFIYKYGCSVCETHFMVEGYDKPSYCPGCGAQFEQESSR